jgi:hypothetical protein
MSAAPTVSVQLARYENFRLTDDACSYDTVYFCEADQRLGSSTIGYLLGSADLPDIYSRGLLFPMGYLQTNSQNKSQNAGTVYLPSYCTSIAPDFVEDGEAAHWEVRCHFETVTIFHRVPKIHYSNLQYVRDTETAYAVEYKTAAEAGLTQGNTNSNLSLSSGSNPTEHIENTAQDSISPMVQNEEVHQVIDITLSRTAQDSVSIGDWVQKFRDTVNLNLIKIAGFTIPAGFGRILEITYTAHDCFLQGGAVKESAVDFYNLHFRIEISPRGFWEERANVGLGYFDEDDDDVYKSFRNGDGSLAQEPYPLDADGYPLTTGSTLNIYIQRKRAIAWDELKLPEQYIKPTSSVERQIVRTI